jgi:hypothetical protein
MYSWVVGSHSASSRAVLEALRASLGGITTLIVSGGVGWMHGHIEQTQVVPGSAQRSQRD